MADEPAGVARNGAQGVWGAAPDSAAHAEQRELDTLRSRAYGPAADIALDPVAMARLIELEERVRLERFPRATEPAAVDALEAEGGAGAPAGSADVTPAAPNPARGPRWHTALVAATAAIAVLLGGAAWSDSRSRAEQPGARYAKTAAVAIAQRNAGYEAGYELYLDRLRDEVLALPGADAIADLMIREQLQPYGILYGRTVGAGPTIDHEFCMIIADLPTSSITCIPVENAYANPVSVVLPSWYSDSESDVFTGLGPLVTYTLMPGGSVIAEPVDATTVAAPASHAATTASPPPHAP